jgi:hypothetical protein
MAATTFLQNTLLPNGEQWWLTRLRYHLNRAIGKLEHNRWGLCLPLSCLTGDKVWSLAHWANTAEFEASLTKKQKLHWWLWGPTRTAPATGSDDDDQDDAGTDDDDADADAEMVDITSEDELSMLRLAIRGALMVLLRLDRVEEFGTVSERIRKCVPKRNAEAIWTAMRLFMEELQTFLYKMKDDCWDVPDVFAYGVYASSMLASFSWAQSWIRQEVIKWPVVVVGDKDIDTVFVPVDVAVTILTVLSKGSSLSNLAWALGRNPALIVASLVAVDTGLNLAPSSTLDDNGVSVEDQIMLLDLFKGSWADPGNSFSVR